MWLHSIKLIIYMYAVFTLLPKSWQRIKKHAQNAIEYEKIRRKKLKEATKVKKRRNESDTPVVRRAKSVSQVANELTSPPSSHVNNNRTGDSFEQGQNNSTQGKYSVSKIAHEYEQKAQKQKVHVASSLVLQKSNTMSFFEGHKVPLVKGEPPNNGLDHSPPTSNSDLDEPLPNHHQHKLLSNSLSNILQEDDIVNQLLLSNHQDNSNTNQLDVVIRRRKKPHVETVEDILLQQRFSRSLSSYSISDLLKDQPAEPNIDQIIDDIN